MRFVIQRVTKASVSVDGKIISEIGRGLCVLVGICRDDTDEDIEYGVRKLLNLRIFDNPGTQKRWDKSVSDVQCEILCVSQFTLHSILKGDKLDFHRSMGPDQAPDFYSKFLDKLRTAYVHDKIKDGQFGAYMSVNIENDGPVTINLDSKARE